MRSWILVRVSLLPAAPARAAQATDYVEYVGEYIGKSVFTGMDQIVKVGAADGYLTLTIGGFRPSRFYRGTEDHFIEVDEGWELQFLRDGDGRITGYEVTRTDGSTAKARRAGRREAREPGAER